MKRFDVNRYIEFHIYDHDKDESFQIVGKSNLIRWLNVRANIYHYSFFSSYESLQRWVIIIKEGKI